MRQEFMDRHHGNLLVGIVGQIFPQTRFRIGSMNKMFTAVATLQLVQANKLGLNDVLECSVFCARDRPSHKLRRKSVCRS
jgi:hypothetical protein